jgi:hypothetical protein
LCPEAKGLWKEPDSCTEDMQSQGEKMNESEVQVMFAKLNEKLAAQEARIKALEENVVEEVPEETPEVPEE